MAAARRLLLTVAASALAASTLVTTAGPASAAGCSTTRTTTMYVTGRASQTEFHTYIDRSGVTTTSPRTTLRASVNTGYEAVRVVGCKDASTGAWRAIDTSMQIVPRDLTLTLSGTSVTARPAYGNVGYGVMVSSVSSSAVAVRAVACKKAASTITALGVARGVTGLPFPGRPVVTLPLYAVNKLLPAAPAPRYYCGQLGSTVAIPWSFSSTGVATLRMPTSGQYVRNGRATYQTVCSFYTYCGTSMDQTVLVRRGT